jgi:hypothetical protein
MGVGEEEMKVRKVGRWGGGERKYQIISPVPLPSLSLYVQDFFSVFKFASILLEILWFI